MTHMKHTRSTKIDQRENTNNNNNVKEQAKTSNIDWTNKKRLKKVELLLIEEYKRMASKQIGVVFLLCAFGCWGIVFYGNADMRFGIEIRKHHK